MNRSVNFESVVSNIYNACYNDTIATLQEYINEDEVLEFRLINGVLPYFMKVENTERETKECHYINSVKYYDGDIYLNISPFGNKWICYDFYDEPELIVKLNTIIKKNIENPDDEFNEY